MVDGCLCPHGSRFTIAIAIGKMSRAWVRAHRASFECSGRRLGYRQWSWVGLWCLFASALAANLGLILYTPPHVSTPQPLFGLRAESSFDI